VLKKNILISLMILFVGLFVGFQILVTKSINAAPDGHTKEVASDPPTPRGPHNGRLFTDKDLTIEIQIHETGVPPEFHIYFYRNDQSIPVSEVNLTAKVIRMGQTDPISFKQEKDYLLSEQVIYEPHSFKVVFDGVYQGQKHQWSFTQEEGRVHVAPDLLKRSEIKVLKAGPRSLGKRMQFPAQITLDQDKYVHVESPIQGRALNVYKHVGERVKQGELLAVLSSRELSDLRLEQQLLNKKTERSQSLYQRENKLYTNTKKLLKLLQQDKDPESIHRQMMKTPVGENKTVLLSAFADLRLERQKYQREKQLQTDQISSKESLQSARTDYDKALSHYTAAVEEVLWQRESVLLEKRQDLEAAQAEQSAIAQKLQVLQVSVGATGAGSARYEMRSPINGIISEKNLAIGETVTTDKPSFVIANLSVVWVEVQVPDLQLQQVRSGQRVQVYSQDGKRNSVGVIAHISPGINPSSRRAEAEVHISNPDEFWKPGMFVNVAVTTAERTVPIAVAKSALQSYNDWTVVYAKFGDTFEIRPLEQGQEDQDWVEVKEGLSAGQAYAATNSFILKAEIGKKAATHDH
jgi:membrane fusion protein, heavy metal efflux system